MAPSLPPAGWWRAPSLVFAVALAVRLLHLLAFQRSPYFTHPVVDGETYHQAALALVGGQGFPDTVFWQPPGYPYFLALIYWLAGPSLLAPRLAQAGTGALTAALSCVLGTQLFGARVGLAAGLGVAFYGILVYFDGEILAPSLAIALQLTAIVLAHRARDHTLGWLAAGLFAGLTAVVNATALVLLPVMALFARRHVGWLVLGAALAVAPLSARNWLQRGEVLLISSNLGVNFFIGNNPRYDAMVAVRPGRDWQALLRAPWLHGARSPGAASRFFVRRALTYARSDPAGFTRLQLRKLRLLVGGDEIPRNQEIYPARTYSPVLWALLWKQPGLAFPFGVLLPPAALGLVVGARRAPMLATMLVALAGAGVAFFVTARYRAPLVPLMVVFAAEGVRWLWMEARGVAGRVAAVALVALGGLANAGQGPMPTHMNADAEFGLATWFEREGRRDEALRLYREIVAREPDYFDVWVRLGLVLALGGRSTESAEAFRIAGSLVPTYYDTLVWEAERRVGAGCLTEAADYYRKAIELEPSGAFPRLRLERTLAALAAGASSPAPCPLMW